MPLKRRAAPRAEIMGWDGSAWQRLPVESATNPNLRTAIYDGNTRARVVDYGQDAMPNANNQICTVAYRYGFNDSSWDRWRNNTEATVLASATRTSSGASSDQTNYNAKGVIIWINVTAVSGTFAAGEGLKIRVNGKDPTAGVYIWISPTIGPYTTTGYRQILIYPGATDTAGVIEGKNDIPLPRTWRVEYEISGTNPSFTFSVGASYIV